MNIPSSIHKYWWSLALLFPAIVLWRMHPSSITKIPICSLKRMTGLNCPGCGATRATHFLLNGDWPSALQHNAAYVGLLPLAMLGFIYMLWQKRHTNYPTLPLIPLLIIVALSLTFFGVLRNIPGFEWLNPPSI